MSTVIPTKKRKKTCESLLTLNQKYTGQLLQDFKTNYLQKKTFTDGNLIFSSFVIRIKKMEGAGSFSGDFYLLKMFKTNAFWCSRHSIKYLMVTLIYWQYSKIQIRSFENVLIHFIYSAISSCTVAFLLFCCDDTYMVSFEYSLAWSIQLKIVHVLLFFKSSLSIICVLHIFFTRMITRMSYG